MKFIIGTKLNMTQVFDQEGNVHPVTILKAGPVTVTQVKESGKDGYSAVQIGFGEIREKLVSKPQQGHTKALGLFRTFKEFRVAAPTHKLGDKFDVSVFKEGDEVEVSSVSKGKGFQGAMKRHNFGGLRASHGVSVSHRSHGSTGQCQDPGKVFKGKKMAGHMGAVRCTTQNLQVIRTDAERGLLMIKGAVPGSKGGWVTIKDAVKKAAPADLPLPAAIRAAVGAAAAPAVEAPVEGGEA